MPNNIRPSTFTDIASENDELYIKDNTGNITSHPIELTFVDEVTLAQIQAGRTLINGVKGKKIRILRVAYLVKGLGFTGGTSVVLQDNSTVPIVIVTGLTANLTLGAKNNTDGTVLTIGPGCYELLPDGASVVVKADAGFTAGGTVFMFIQYQLV